MHPWSIYTGCHIFITSDVRDIITALIVLALKSVHIAAGSKYIDIVLFAVVEPEVVIELKIKAVVDVMESCLVNSLSLISVCEYVRLFVYTSDVFCSLMPSVIYGVVNMFGRRLCCQRASGLCSGSQVGRLLSV